MADSTIDARWVKGMRLWVKKTFGPTSYTSVEEIQSRFRKALKVELPRLSEYLLLKKGMLPFPKEEGMGSMIDDLRAKIGSELKVAREILEEGKGRIDFQVNASTPGTFEAEHRPDILQFYAEKPEGWFLKAMEEIANEVFGKVEDILSGRLLRFVTSWLTKYGGGIGFETEEILTQFTIGKMKVIWDDSNPRLQRNPRSVKEYLPHVHRAQALLERRGLGKVWYGETFLGCKECGGENPYGKHFGVGGHYLIGKDVVVLFSDPSSGITELLVHELGHRYYYKFMTPADRARFDAYFGEVSATSDYGSKATEEDFAEVFASFVMGKDLTRDQIDRFKAFLAKEDRGRLASADWPEHVSGYGTDSELYSLISAFGRRSNVSLSPQESYLYLRDLAGSEAADYQSFLDWVEANT